MLSMLILLYQRITYAIVLFYRNIVLEVKLVVDRYVPTFSIKIYELNKSTHNKAHLHRSINAEAKANEHSTSDMTYK